MIHTVKFPSGKQTHALVAGAEHKDMATLTRSDLVCNPGRGNVATVQASLDTEPTCTRCVKALAVQQQTDVLREQQGEPKVNRGDLPHCAPSSEQEHASVQAIEAAMTAGEAALAPWEADLSADVPPVALNPHYACNTHGAVCPTGEHLLHTPGFRLLGCQRCAAELDAESDPAVTYRIQARRAPGEWVTCTNYAPFAAPVAAQVQAKAASVLVPDSQWRVIDEADGTVVWAGPEVTAQVPPAGASLLIGSAGYGTARRERIDGPMSFRAPRGKHKASKRRYGR